MDGSDDCDVGCGTSGMEGSIETAMEDEDEFEEAPEARTQDLLWLERAWLVEMTLPQTHLKIAELLSLHDLEIALSLQFFADSCWCCNPPLDLQ